VAGQAAGRYDTVAYFPSYEIITGAPFANRFWERNLRDVTDDQRPRHQPGGDAGDPLKGGPDQ
ncbi:MAG: hypothetical protein EBU57_06325, partial [Alphaproteobacteria bacterium]|nr:hypothetical protein [Alphaproteobacteria bacterium]